VCTDRGTLELAAELGVLAGADGASVKGGEMLRDPRPTLG
jgi:hypothetical protein